MNKVNKFIVLSALLILTTVVVSGLFSVNVFAAECTGPGGTCGSGPGAGSQGGDATATLSTRSVGWVYIPLNNVQSVAPTMSCNGGTCTFPGVHTAHTNISGGSFTDLQQAKGIYVYGALAQKNGSVNGVQYKAGQLITPIGISSSSDAAWRLPQYGGYARQSPYALNFNDVKARFNALVAAGKIHPGPTQHFGVGSTLSMFADWDGVVTPAETPTPTPTPKPPVTPPPSEDCGDGYNYGDTDGKVSVANLTKDNVWVSDGYVWARPGDTIRFTISYCWAAQGVRGGVNNSSSPFAVPSYYHNYFRIEADPTNDYFFGEHDLQAGNTYYLNNYQSSPRSAIPGVGFFDQTGSWKFQIYSPSSRPASQSMYNCQVNDFLPHFVSYGFQIPGYEGNCPAASMTGNSTGWYDVGKDTTSSNHVGEAIAQHLYYNRVAAWRKYKYYNNGGYCTGCDHYVNYAWCGKEYDGGAKPQWEYNTLEVQNCNYGWPFSSLWEALNSCGGDSWGRVIKFRDNSYHNTNAPACDSGGSCAPNAWRRWNPKAGEPIYGDPRWVIDLATGIAEENIIGYEPDYLPCTVCHTNDFGSVDSEVNGYAGKNWWMPQIDYSTDWDDYGEQHKWAGVKTPFNYTTEVESFIEGHGNGVVYLGDGVSSHFTVSINPRINTSVRPSEAYATIVDGHAKAYEFIVAEDGRMNDYSIQGSKTAYGNPCDYYGSRMTILACNEIENDGRDILNDLDGPLNPQGLYAGIQYTWGTDARQVPDIYPVGSKYCVAVYVSTSDSHGRPNDYSVDGMSDPYAYTNVSGASCRTIAKRPSFQVWNGGLYSAGSIQTTNSLKKVDATLGAYSSPDSIFGSWAEYYVAAQGTVYGLSSGAATGYFGKENNTSLGLRGGAPANANNCDITKMTIANTTCNTQTTGSSNIHNISQEVILQRLRARYTIEDSGYNSGSFAGDKLDNGARYVKRTDNIRISDIVNALYWSSSADDTKERNCLRWNGGWALTMCKGESRNEDQVTANYASNTLIIHSNKKVIIDRNICYGEGACNDQNNSIRLGDNDQTFDSIYSLPQVLIIAEEGIDIEREVNQVDAWLITEGEIDTCSNGFKLGDNESSCKTTLMVNGPVFASSMQLNRVGGANPGTGDTSGGVLDRELSGHGDKGSINSGEIFNLRPDVLYWAYSQAQRFSQANVTYTGELAPRF
ncbi:hypothetical protein IJG79_00735 [Candidatus Saccharibacteria bacterium]|nr:hypothetical protein [Candidatus Saccharibacteria bacterium]